MTRSIRKFATVLMLCVMTTACSSGRVAIRPDELKTSHDILVIPYKASPIKVEANNTFAVGVAFGLLGSAIQQSATAEARAKTAEYLNKAAGSWNPSLVAAEECLKVLKSSSKISINNSSIGDLSEIPGVARLRQEEPRIFTQSNSHWSMKWDGLARDFRDTNSSFIEYKKNHVQANADWTLEIFNTALLFSNDYMTSSLIMKLSNSSTSQTIAVGLKGDKYKMSPLPEGYDFNDFEQRLRNISQKACTMALSEMGLY